MKITIQQSELAKALKAVASMTPGRSTLSILYQLLIEVARGEIKILYSNLDSCVRLTVGARTEGEGRFLVDASKFNAAVSRMKGEIEIEVDVSLSAKSADGFACSFPIGNADEYPLLIESVRAGKPLIVTVDALAEIRHNVGYAVSDDFTRVSLTGVFLERKEKVLQAFATDGHSASKRVFDVTGGKEFKESIIPVPAISSLMGFLSDSEEVDLWADGTTLTAKFLGGEFVCKVVDGPYSDYRKVLLNEKTGAARVNKADFLEVLDQVIPLSSNLTSKNDKYSSVSAKIENGSVTVSGMSQQYGTEGSRTLTCETFGTEIEFGAGAGNMVNMIKAIGGSEIDLIYSKPLSAIFAIASGIELKAELDVEKNLSVLMPMRMLERKTK